MKFPTVSATLVLALLVAGCEGRSPAFPTAPTSAGARWKLTTTLTSITGPAVCWRFPDIGTSWDALMAIRRSGESISLLYDVNQHPLDQVEYVGTLEGDNFTASSEGASSEGSTGSFNCGEDYSGEARVSGRFSSNGRALIAKGVLSHKLTTGEEVNLHFDWIATRQ